MRREVLPAGRIQEDVARLFGVHTVLPAQLPRRVAGSDSGTRALLTELLRVALRDAGVMRSIAPPHPRRRAIAIAWLTGTLDDQVALPIGFVCDGLGLDAGALAAAVWARVVP